MEKSADLFKGIELRTPRHTVINWPNKVIDIVDGYREHRGVAHGVQKDAIQNGWDARLNKPYGRDWSFIFELVKGKSGRSFLTMTDKGTTGLTGRVLKPEELQEDLPPEERWRQVIGELSSINAGKIYIATQEENIAKAKIHEMKKT